MKHPCPHCNLPVDWDEKPQWRPFCSERCRMIDLGAWLSEENAIPGEPVDPSTIEPNAGNDQD